MKGRAAELSTEAVEGEERKRPKGSQRETQKSSGKRSEERNREGKGSAEGTRKAPVRRNVEEGKGRNRGQVVKVLNGRERNGRTAKAGRKGRERAHGRSRRDRE